MDKDSSRESLEADPRYTAFIQKLSNLDPDHTRIQELMDRDDLLAKQIVREFKKTPDGLFYNEQLGTAVLGVLGVMATGAICYQSDADGKALMVGFAGTLTVGYAWLKGWDVGSEFKRGWKNHLDQKEIDIAFLEYALKEMS
jgi:hypothetical protein